METNKLTYRIVIHGPLGSGWADWFGEPGQREGDNTVLLLSEVDRSTFYGLIRTLGDLDRTLVSVELTGGLS